MTLSLAAVFIPVLFMGGILGRLLHEFAVTISVAILVSGLVSLSLTPMLCSRFLRASKETAARPAVDGCSSASSTGCYGFTIAPCRSRSGTIRHHGGFRAVVWWRRATCSWRFPKGFLPDEDQGQIFIFTEGPQGISFDNMVEHQMGLEQDCDGAALHRFLHVHGGGMATQGVSLPA